jgi:hypothetical protein
MDYTEALEETPAFTLFKLFIRQFLYVSTFLLGLLGTRLTEEQVDSNYISCKSFAIPSCIIVIELTRPQLGIIEKEIHVILRERV